MTTTGTVESEQVQGRGARWRPSPGESSAASYLRHKKPLSGRSGLLMVLPVQLLFLAFFLAPFAYALYISLTSPQSGSFEGFQNFSFAIHSATFWNSIGRVAYFGVVQVTAMVIIGLLLAFLIDSPLVVGKRVFRLVYFLPYAVPGVLAAIMWGFLFSPTLNSLLHIPVTLGLTHHPLNPLSSGFILYAIMLIVTWEFTGYNMTLYLTSLASIPQSMLDAAAIDGCGQVRLVRYIKLPLIRRMIMFTLVLSIIGTLQLFNEPEVLSSMSTIPNTFTPNMNIYNEAFSIGNVPLASAMSLLLGAVTVGTSLIFYVLWRRMGRSKSTTSSASTTRRAISPSTARPASQASAPGTATTAAAR